MYGACIIARHVRRLYMYDASFMVFSVLGGRKIVLPLLLLLDHIRGGTAGALESECL